MSNALITVALLTQLKLLPILTLLSMLVESVTTLKERETIDPTSQFPATRQISFWGMCMITNSNIVTAHSRLKKTNKPVIVVLSHGAPVPSPAYSEVDAVISAGYTGQGQKNLAE